MSTKRCPACEEQRLPSEFGSQTVCKLCWSSYTREYRQRPGVMKKAQRRDRQRKRDLMEWSHGKKRDNCLDCKRKFNPWQMQFDHRPGTVKVASVSDMVMRGFAKKKIEQEIEKCDLVCASCHADRTYQRRVAQK